MQSSIHTKIGGLPVLLLSVMVAAGLSPTTASAVTVTLGAGKASTIFENQPDNSIGRGPGVFAGGDSNGSPRRGLIDFNVAANIPVGAIITSAQLSLYLGAVGVSDTGTPDSVSRMVELHRLVGDWAHGPTGLGVVSIDGTDQGYPAVPPSPTWNERRYQQNQPWSTPGGDFKPAASATTLVGQQLNTAYTWLSTPDLVADVQFMLDQPSLGFGWMIVNPDERVSGSYRAFYTKDWTDPLMRPQLLLTYELAPVPVPAAVWLFGSGLLAVAGIFRRSSSRHDASSTLSAREVDR
ncbi:hypothetical protein W02_42250 [Nitrospira sp. KM1]|uniref:hypothetical protein n=1 Tax=Nitrospira sp. KM1 TaxID=1936990 RepID=UPI0013A7B478|nr:hypothetical protein [Nitrospira sp. KM1]BCA57085.1 hypothetical protein W02_42250 [Nitrospira sp. KM1]